MTNSKLARLNNSLAHPRRTGDLHIYFMEIMEQIEFSGNDTETREQFFTLFKHWGNYWFPNEHPVDLFDRIYADTKELVAA